MYDIIIKNGTVIDGVNKTRYKSDVAVQKGKIAEISPSINSNKALEVIDAAGAFVVPGFIDIQNHSDSYWTLFDQPEQLSLLSQGITTAIIGNCGSSLAPLPNPEALKTIQKWHDLSGININWSSFEEFLQTLALKNLSLNVGSLVGHSTLRRSLVGDQIRNVTKSELKVMDKMLREALNQGALGLSMGLVYAHEVDSNIEELIELADTLKEQKKYLSVHLRSEGSHLLESLDEVIDIATRAQIPVKISHLKVREKKNWHLFGQMINKLENAYHQGLDITFDVYPYTSSWSILYTYLPKWAYEGGRKQVLKHLDSEMDRRKILDYVKEQAYNFEGMIVANSEGTNSFIGKSVAKIAKSLGVSNEEAMLKILSASGTQVIVFDHNLNPEHVELLLSSPLSIIATDGAGYSENNPTNLVHPRCFGTMPKFLQLVREKNLMSWEQAVKKITAEPARILGLTDRGRLAVGAVADITVFNPEKIKALADYEHPYQFAEGIERVVINGKIVFADKKLQRINGQVISR